MDSEREKEEVAATLDATAELTPHLPELLADLFDLGGSPELVLSWLRWLGLSGPETRVLDLGCGKGAVSLLLARELGVSVHGVDLFEPMIEDAVERAKEWDLEDLCRFEAADLRDALRDGRGAYDAVVYVSVGVLGRLDECVRVMRQGVKRGGVMVIEDGVLAPGATPEEGFDYLAPARESRRLLTAHGDTLVREQTQSKEETRARDRSYIERIEGRASALAEAHPTKADLFRSYVTRQWEAADAWERNAVGAAWLLKKGR